MIPEYAAKRLLADAGIPVPRAELASDLAAAQQAAARIGYPVVLKAQSADLAHPGIDREKNTARNRR